MSHSPVTLCVASSGYSRHRMGVLRGLFELAAESLVRVDFLRRRDWDFDIDTLLLLRYEHPEFGRINCVFDTRDAPDIIHHAALDGAQFFFKRSYDPLSLAHLSSHLREKVLPYGLSLPADIEKFPVSSRFYWQQLLDGVPGTVRRTQLFELVKNVVNRVSRRRHSGYALDTSQLPVANYNDLVRSPRVFFQTRLWDPVTTVSRFYRSTQHINTMRVALVRALRREFGARFIGGVIPGTIAERECPDALTTHGSDFSSYLANVSRSLVAVTEAGIHGSNGARLPELLGAGRCVVSERLVFELPRPLRDGAEILFFDSVDGCVTRCDEVLTNPARAVEIARAGRRFYEGEASPSALVRRALLSAGLHDSIR